MKKRLRIVSACILLVGAIFVVKLFSIQVVNGERFRERADRQYVTPNDSIFERGSIMFMTKDGDAVSAATLKTGYKLAVIPTDLHDPKDVYAQLSEYIELDKSRFVEKASKANDPYEDIIDELSKETADAISALDIDGVRLYKHKWRAYPGDTLAAQTIGFMGYKGDELAGRYGIERYYNETLVREDPNLYVNFFAEIFGNMGTVLSDSATREGDVELTIEPVVQGYLQEALQGIMEEWNSESAGGIIMHPQTGAIYAMESVPSFDPNEYGSVDDIRIFSNPMVERVYEMGSIVKPLIMAAGIETGAVTAHTEYYDSGSVEVGDRTIRNYDRRGRGQVTMQDVINESLNTGMVYVQQAMSKSDFKKYITSYNWGEKTGIDLPGEVSGLTSNIQSNRDVEYANISFGQGIAMTPISMIRSLASLANGGVLMQPYVVQRIDYVGGLHDTIKPAQQARVLTQETTDEITRMLVEAVDSTLLGGDAKMDHYSIAAKTGTAQIPDPTGGYYSDRNLHSFFGYFPAYDPEFILFLYTMHPQGVRYSSQTLAQPFMDMADFLINYYQVPPDREPLPVSTENE